MIFFTAIFAIMIVILFLKISILNDRITELENKVNINIEVKY